MGYKVVVDVMDAVDPTGPTYPDGRPKEVKELHAGDEVDEAYIGAQRLQELIAAGAIAKDEPAEEAAPKAAPAPKP